MSDHMDSNAPNFGKGDYDDVGHPMASHKVDDYSVDHDTAADADGAKFVGDVGPGVGRPQKTAAGANLV